MVKKIHLDSPIDTQPYEKDLTNRISTGEYLWPMVYYFADSYSRKVKGEPILSEEWWGKLCDYLVASWERMSDNQRKVLNLEDLKAHECNYEVKTEFEPAKTFFLNMETLLVRIEERSKIDASFDRRGCAPAQCDLADEKSTRLSNEGKTLH